MNVNKLAHKIASEHWEQLLASKIAKNFTAFEMTKTEWEKYRRDHPDADKSNHKIVDDPKTETESKPESHSKTESTKKTEPDSKEKPAVVKKTIVHPTHRISLSKEQLHHALTKGHYSIISAGRNPANPDESKLSENDPVFHERHKKLQQNLEDLNLPYTEVVGHYGGTEKTLMVIHDHNEDLSDKTTSKSFMVHHADNEKTIDVNRKKLDALGKKYNQDSVLHGTNGKNEIHFTSGKNENKTCGGEGHTETPDAKDFYTDIELSDKKHTKFRMNIDDCFKQGLL